MRVSFFKPLVAAVLSLSLFGQGCTKALSEETISASRFMELNVWGVIDDLPVYEPVFSAYQKQHPNIQINYRAFRLEEYEDALLNALAEDRGPDVFLIHHTWVGKYQPKLDPMPASTKVAYRVLAQGIKQELTWELRTEPNITMRQFRDAYADAVLTDMIRNINVGTADKPDYQDRIMGIPIAMDTLALYYNKDLLNAANIPTPPENWTQFFEHVKRLVKASPEGKILQAAAGIGTSRNVERGIDLLQVLMVQNGTEMTSSDGRVAFHVMPQTLADRDVPPGERALEFYTDFANSAKEVYTWNADMPNSLEAFILGQTAYFFGYAYHYDIIKARSPRLNLGISKLPQINEQAKNKPNYWAFAVSKKSKRKDYAWNLLNFMQQPDQAKVILENKKAPAARKALLSAQLEDERVGVFASQVLTAVSWYTGKDPATMEAAFRELIDAANAGQIEFARIMRTAAEKVTQTYY